MTVTKKEDRTAKVVVIGDIGVGKTCLLLRFTDNKFSKSPLVTIGADFKKRVLDVADTRVTMEVWDTAGQERYKSLTSRFFRHSNGVMLVFDVTNMKSFLRIQNWLDELDHHEISRSRCLLIGNKTDLSNEREVEYSQASSLATRHDLPYLETSAKENNNVHQAFVTLARQMLAQMKDADYNVTRDTILLGVKLQQYSSSSTQGGTRDKRRQSCVCAVT